MSTAAQLLAKPNVAVAYYFTVSLDGGATISYWYSTVALPYLEAINSGAQARILEIGPLDRSFGVERGLTATAFSVTLDNTDAALDWLCDRDTWPTDTLPSLWCLVAYVYDPQNVADFDTKVLGYYRPTMEAPVRTSSTITLSLSDRVLNDLQLADLPTVRDWIGITDANRPAEVTAVAGQQIDPGNFPNTRFNIDLPVPLWFGSNPLLAQRVAKNTYVLCAVAGSAGALPINVNSIDIAECGSIPSDDTANGTAGSFDQRNWIDANGNAFTVWQVRRTPDITKNGKTWHLMWLDLDLTQNTYPNALTGDRFYYINKWLTAGFFEHGIEYKLDFLKDFDHYGIHDRLTVWAYGRCWSHPDDDVQWMAEGLNGVDIVMDLLSNYTRAAVTVDPTSFARLKSLRPFFRCSGGVGRATGTRGASDQVSFAMADSELVAAVRSLCSLGDFDVFLAWDGTITATAAVSDYTSQSATLGSLSETEVDANIEERIPSTGERGEPFNRVYLVTGAQRFGPWDDATAIAAWQCTRVRVVDASWIMSSYGTDGAGASTIHDRPVWDVAWRYLPGDTGKVRPRVKVRTWLNGLNFELGDYLQFSWSRGSIGSPYASAIFRVEAIRLDAMSGFVSLDLVWADDLRSTGNAPYVLDDETLLTRASGGARTCTLTTGSNTVSFSSGSLLTDGVAAGDHLIILDSTETSNAFKRNRALLISSVTDATHLVINSTYSSNDFGAAGPYTLSTWELRRGALNYRANATVYGKVGDSTHSGKFSDNSTTAYKLLDG